MEKVLAKLLFVGVGLSILFFQNGLAACPEDANVACPNSLPNVVGITKVASFQVRESGGGLVVFHWADSSLPGCYVYPEDTTKGGRAIFTLLLSAFMASKTVSFTCWGGSTYRDDIDASNDYHPVMARLVVK